MNRDVDKAARSMLSSPQGLKIIKILDKLNTISSTEGGLELLNMLAGNGSDLIKTAAKTAAAAPRDRARAFLSSLLATKDGAALIAKVIELSGV